ncbi:MAG TPA: extracellular solute-binding protein [Chloroflexota bacterium]|jgi:multiple sugar transport system substrate-binding protein|nr:extracellular solute-binding protein [Chloroflexota bacterium]
METTVKVVRRRAWLSGLGALPGGIVLAACAGQSSGTGATRSGPQGKTPVTLTLNGTDSEMGEMAAERLPAFEQKYGHIKVQYDNPPDYGTKLFVLAAAGSLGDVAMSYTNTGQYHFLAQNDVFAHHDPLIARDKYDLKQFYDLAVQALRIDGKLFVLPFKGQIARLFAFYNIDLFQSRGVRLPTTNWTYDELVDAATRLHQGSGDQVDTWGYAGNWKELTTIIASVRPWGGEILSSDGKRALTSSNQVKEALNYHYDLALKRRVGGLTTQIDPYETFYQGKAAILGRVNAGIAGTIIPRAEGHFRWGAVRMPKGASGKRGGMWLPGAMSVTKHTTHLDDAWELTKWCCDKESGVALAMQRKGSSTPGARPDVYSDPRLLNREGYPENYGEEQRQAMLEPEPYVTPWNYLGAELNTILGTELDRVTKGELAINDGFLQNLTAQLQAVLDKPPSRLQ